MKETVFKVGDKVYCLLFGWGVVTKIKTYDTEYPVIVELFNKEGGKIEKSYTEDGRYYASYHTIPTLSFTEYTLNGFSQEHPIELPELGEEIMVSDDGKVWVIGRFREYYHQFKHKVEVEVDGDRMGYKYFKRLH
jgi:hypothetical protein